MAKERNQNQKNIHITIDNLVVVRVIALLVAAFLALMLLSKIIQPIILILIACFLALALNPAVSWIARHLKSNSRVRATGVAYLMVISILVAFFAFIFPPLVRQTIDFAKEAPDTLRQIKDENSSIGSFLARYNLDDDVDQLTNDFGGKVKNLGQPALATAGKVGTTVVSAVAVLVLTFMMLVEGPTLIERYFKTLKPRHRAHHRSLANKMYKVVVGYVNGQVLIAFLGGFFATVALFIASQILDVSINVVALGGIVALFALLPLIGTITGSILVIISCLFVSLPLAIVMAIYFVVYQQIENVTLQPYIQSKTNTLTPMLVLIAALLGAGLGGILGVLFAIPTAGCIKVLVDDYFERKRGVTSPDPSNFS